MSSIFEPEKMKAVIKRQRQLSSDIAALMRKYNADMKELFADVKEEFEERFSTTPSLCFVCENEKDIPNEWLYNRRGDFFVYHIDMNNVMYAEVRKDNDND